MRAFDATTDLSPMAFLRQMRVERMAPLPASTDLPIGEIAGVVGGKNEFHASQCFHAAYGLSPSAFRRQRTMPANRTVSLTDSIPAGASRPYDHSNQKERS